MSDEIWNIMTPFADVAELGQGYMARADGQCLWVPLPNQVEVETEVPFVVYLLDGTPAFAGSGRCIQVADQGDAADPQVRYEALLDNLMFDERSQPVYDYIVAVRAAAIEEQGAAVDVAQEGDRESTDVAVDEDFGADSYQSDSVANEAGVQHAMDGISVSGGDEDVLDLPIGITASPSYRPAEQAVQTVLRPSIMPASTGFLSRPIIGLHFQSVIAHGPARSAATGYFEYPAGDLPIPEHPPRPEGAASA